MFTYIGKGFWLSLWLSQLILPLRCSIVQIEIRELDEFAQAAFQGYKSLNRIQSRIFQTTYESNENILVCCVFFVHILQFVFSMLANGLKND